MESGILKAYGAVRGGEAARGMVRPTKRAIERYPYSGKKTGHEFQEREANYRDSWENNKQELENFEEGKYAKHMESDPRMKTAFKQLKVDRKKLNRKTKVANRMGRYEEEDEDFERSNGPNRPRKRKSEYDEMGKHSKTHITPTENLKNKKRKNKLGNSAIFSGADTINFTNNNDGTETVKAMGASAEDIKTAYGKVMLNA